MQRSPNITISAIVNFQASVRARCDGGRGDLRTQSASADLGHAHRADGPYGYDPASAECDARVQQAVSAGDLGPLQELPPDLLDHAKADAPWQLAILHGALGGPRRTLRWAYACPTYFGMLGAHISAE